MKKITLLLLLIYSVSNAQSGLSFSLQQDLKFATIGDKERGYEAFTTDIIARLKMNGNVKGFGYLVVFPEFEFAAIKGKYYRYSANVGYSFNQLILEDFELMPYIGYGYIDRYGKCFSSFGGGLELIYNLSDHFKLVSTGQLTQRNDLKYYWGETDIIKPSIFVGLEYRF